MTTGARKILGMEGRFKAVFGGASASKTYSIIPMLIDKAIANPNEVITIVSDTARNLRDGAQRDFITIMRDFKRWDRSRWKATTNRYEFKNGAIIEFLGADDPDKFRGPRRDRLYVNEANRLAFETFNQLDARTRKEVILDWNPTAPFWYDTEVKGKIAHEWLRLTYLDNESLSPEEIAFFETRRDMAETSTYWANWWRVYGLGLTGMIEGACVKDYKILKDNIIPDGYKLVGMGLDFGDNDPNAAVNLYMNDSEQYIFDEVLYKPKMHISSISSVLKKHDTVVYADYAWPQTINELRKLGHTINKCKKGPDSIKAGIDLINNKDVSVTPRSENLLLEFQSYAYKTDKNGMLEDGKYVGPDHLVDACRYVLTKNVKRRQIKVYL